MKAITLWQPWASLIALGEKKFETRSWATQYRGPLVIHVSKKMDDEVLADYLIPEIMRTFHVRNLVLEMLPVGAAICVARLVNCIDTAAIPLEQRKFGNYQAGRFAWKLENVRVFKEPIPCRGKQGLWEWPLPLPEEVKL